MYFTDINCCYYYGHSWMLTTCVHSITMPGWSYSLVFPFRGLKVSEVIKMNFLLIFITKELYSRNDWQSSNFHASIHETVRNVMEPTSTSQCIQAHNTKVPFYSASCYLAHGYHKQNGSWILILICPIYMALHRSPIQTIWRASWRQEIDSSGEVWCILFF